MKNALCVPSMSHYLVPPFILREAGLEVTEKPKIHCKDLSVEDHSLFHKEYGLRIPFTLDGMFTVFPTCALTDKEIGQAEVYSTIYLTPDLHKWDPPDESYKIKEDSFLDCNGDMVVPPPSSNNDFISEAEMTAALVECDDNDMAVNVIDTVMQPACGSSVSWRDDMFSRRWSRKRRERVDRLKKQQKDAEEDLIMAEAQLEAAMDEMDSSDQADSDDSLWVSSLNAEAMISRIDSVLDGSIFSAFVEDEAANKNLIFQADHVRAEVSSVSLVYDPEALNDLLDDQIAKAKFSGAVGSTYVPSQRS